MRVKLGATLLAVAVATLGLPVVVAAPAQADAACTVDAGVATCEFAFTGATEQWTVPTGVTSITADVFGAAGGDATQWNNIVGGRGGRATAVLPVQPGDVLNVTVGGAGSTNVLCETGGVAGGFNGGGRTSAKGCSNASGGGASDVRVGGAGLEHRVLVAGGGGGSVAVTNSQYGNFIGGAGGGLVGGAGVVSVAGDGAGGDQNGGGSGMLGIGGDGRDATSADPQSPGSGGGGGGYYGGAGGGPGYLTVWGTAGGGGSGYGPAGTVFENGVRTGNGLITITYNTATSSVELGAVNDHIFVDETIDLTATVEADPAVGDLAGTAKFWSGEELLGEAPVSSDGQAELSGVQLPVGEHALAVEYSGNAGVNGSRSAETTVTVQQRVATVTLSLDRAATKVGETVQMSASVAPAELTGSVEFFANGESLGSAPIESGVATLAIASLPEGSYDITARYAGNSVFAISTSQPVALAVAPAPVDPVDPVNPVDPVDPVDPVEPTKPAESGAEGTPPTTVVTPSAPAVAQTAAKPQLATTGDAHGASPVALAMTLLLLGGAAVVAARVRSRGDATSE